MTTNSLALSDIIQQEIAANMGMISFERFMSLALYHPNMGYYEKLNIDIGKLGDFTTASEISPLYARCFALEARKLFDHLKEGDILEVGAGTGRFAGELLSELRKNNVPVKTYFILEISKALRMKQKAIIAAEYPDCLKDIVWLDSFPEMVCGLIILNEVLDALAVTCFAIENKTIQERMVAIENNQFVFKHRKALSPLKEDIQSLVDKYDLPNHYQSEINLQLPTFIQSLSKTLEQGVILFADYGYGEAEYYHPERKKGTLTCFYQHQKHDNPLLHPGEQDITAHVNFTQVISLAHDHGLELAGFTTQAAFLLNNGLTDFAMHLSQNYSEIQQFHLHQAIKRLTLPMEMGERVKVMALKKNIELSFPSFLIQDRRRDL